MMSIRKRNGTWHGIVGRDRVEFKEEDDGPSFHRALIVERLEANSPAAKSGLQRGDAVLKVGDTPVSSTLDLERALLDIRAGDSAAVVVQRGKTDQRIDLTIQAADRAAPSANEL